MHGLLRALGLRFALGLRADRLVPAIDACMMASPWDNAKHG